MCYNGKCNMCYNGKCNMCYNGKCNICYNGKCNMCYNAYYLDTCSYFHFAFQLYENKRKILVWFDVIWLDNWCIKRYRCFVFS